MNIYIHTLDGLPAAFNGQQICFMCDRAEPAYSLKQIRQEQKKSKKWRESRGYDCSDDIYGYRLIRINHQTEGE